ncbi:hypothetical protein QQF64_005229 [Cirrhinus molitorella]|uniref:Uncharacterized protein n=1 Tax=Cirrhinus molitorella TaxID=172907 RepID=A0ABR3MIG1_9TELE
MVKLLSLRSWRRVLTQRSFTPQQSLHPFRAALTVKDEEMRIRISEKLVICQSLVTREGFDLTSGVTVGGVSTDTLQRPRPRHLSEGLLCSCTESEGSPSVRPPRERVYVCVCV